MEFAIAALGSMASAIGGAVGIGGAGAASAGAGALATGNFLGAGLGAAGGAASAGGGLASLFSGGSVLSSILAGTATVAGMMGAQQQGEEQSRVLMAQAADARTEQDIERIRGNERRDSLRRSLLQTLGERDVAAAASGVDLSFGTAATARNEAARDAERALVMDQSTEDARIGRLRERENEFTRSARSAKRGSLYKQFGLGVQGVSAATRRYA